MQLGIFCLVNYAIKKNEPENRAVHTELYRPRGNVLAKKTCFEMKIRKANVGAVHLSMAVHGWRQYGWI